MSPDHIDLIFLWHAVNGNWTNWGAWTPCTKTCGLSYRKRSRSCTNPPPRYGGSGCNGKNDQVERCVGRACKLTVHYSLFDSFPDNTCTHLANCQVFGFPSSGSSAITLSTWRGIQIDRRTERTGETQVPCKHISVLLHTLNTSRLSYVLIMNRSKNADILYLIKSRLSHPSLLSFIRLPTIFDSSSKVTLTWYLRNLTFC